MIQEVNMTDIVITKQLATMQDLLLGSGQETQTRNGVEVIVDKIDFISANTFNNRLGGAGELVMQGIAINTVQLKLTLPVMLNDQLVDQPIVGSFQVSDLLGTVVRAGVEDGDITRYTAQNSTRTAVYIINAGEGGTFTAGATYDLISESTYLFSWN